MKKYKDIIEEVKALNANIRTMEKEIMENTEKYKSIVKGNTFKERLQEREKFKEQLDELNKKDISLSLQIEHGKIKVKLLQNNARIALFHEVVPVILEVLEKYNNKPYGEKTREKIRLEVREKTGCGFYIDDGLYRNSYTIYPLDTGNTYKIECGTKYNQEMKDFPKLLIDNKVQLYTMENLELYGITRTYYDDTENVIEELKALHKQAEQKKAELEHICSMFNNLAVTGIRDLNPRETIYKSLLV